MKIYQMMWNQIKANAEKSTETDFEKMIHKATRALLSSFARRMFLGLLVLALSGCASFGQKLKAFMGGSEPQTQKVSLAGQPGGRGSLKYSEKADAPFDEGNRQYRRVTRESLEKDNLGGTEAGSLWQMEGQGSYLFSQNMVRVVGDVLNINIDGEPKKQLITKANIISSLQKKQARPPAVAKPGSANATDKKAEKAEADAAAAAAAAAKEKEAAAKSSDKDGEKDDDKDGVFTVSAVPSRVIERMPDGSYRVRGSQSFMIGKVEYRVIATGLVRSSDVTDNGVDSSKILDSKFDIVSLGKEPHKETAKQ